MFWKHVDKILSWDDDEEIEATVKEVVEMERQASLAPITSAAHSKEEILSHITAIGSTNIHLSTSPEGRHSIPYHLLLCSCAYFSMHSFVSYSLGNIFCNCMLFNR